MLAVVVALDLDGDPGASLAFAAGFAAVAGLALWIVLARRIAARLRDGGPRAR